MTEEIRVLHRNGGRQHYHHLWEYLCHQMTILISEHNLGFKKFIIPLVKLKEKI
jgi:hypothetical protein